MTPAEFPDTWHEGMNITRMGVVTTIHLCDLGIEGTLESAGKAFCPLRHLREFDVDGSHFTGAREARTQPGCTQRADCTCSRAGPMPRWLATCFPHLRELDLSYSRLTGTLPEWVNELGGGKLEQFKIEHNSITGAIPAAFGRRFDRTEGRKAAAAILSSAVPWPSILSLSAARSCASSITLPKTSLAKRASSHAIMRQ